LAVILDKSPWLTEMVDPAFWVNVSIAVGTIAAAVVATILGLGAYRGDKARKQVEALMELRRQAELQAVRVLISWEGATEREPNRASRVNLLNGSDQPIYQVNIWMTVDGVRTLSDVSETWTRPGETLSATVKSRKPAGPKSGLATFLDAYGREWSLSTEDGLQLETSVPITASKSAMKSLARSAE
jgi:hypothetical protein